LRIYEALLNSLHRQKDVRSTTDETTGFRQTKTSITKTTDIDDSTKYRALPASTTYNESIDWSRYGIYQSTLDQNQTTTTRQSMKRTEQDVSDLNDEYIQTKILVTRKYKGKKDNLVFKCIFKTIFL
jgi:hypothetical protein